MENSKEGTTVYRCGCGEKREEQNISLLLGIVDILLHYESTILCSEATPIKRVTTAKQY